MTLRLCDFVTLRLYDSATLRPCVFATIKTPNMKREEFLIYYLLYAIDAASIKKQNLVQMALKTDAVTFVRIYNIIQQQDETARKSIITSNLNNFNKEEIIEEIKNVFLKDFEIEIQEAVVKALTIV
mgnify:CR=1 FL=1